MSVTQKDLDKVSRRMDRIQRDLRSLKEDFKEFRVVIEGLFRRPGAQK